MAVLEQLRMLDDSENVLVYGQGFGAHYRQLGEAMQQAADSEMAKLIPEIAAFIFAAKTDQIADYVRLFPDNAGLVEFVQNTDREVVLLRGKISFTIEISNGAFCFSKVVARLIH